MKKRFGKSTAAGGRTAAAHLSFEAQIVQDRAAGTNVISDAAILQSAEVIEYDEYADNHAYNTVGEIIKHNGRYYEIKAAHTSNAAAYPVETTLRVLSLDRAFTRPERLTIRSRIRKRRGSSLTSFPACITATRGAVYLAKADMPNCVYPPDTARLWQWEKVT
ncbi:MAG: hypothetical protein ACLR1P_07745 [Oscillospiraceae bacterium]